MDLLIERDRELLAAAARHHLAGLPAPVSSCLSAAVDELTDPLALPALRPVPPRATADLPAVLRAVRDRLTAAARHSSSVAESLTCARAARELTGALAALDQQPGRPTAARWPAARRSPAG